MGEARSPDGTTLTLDSNSLLLNGKPWTPVMGEFHFARYPENEWREELLKMKAGGIDIVSTYVSWIHHEDFVRSTQWLMDHEEIEGVVNIAAPNPLPNEDFMRILRDAFRTSIGLPATKWMLEVGAFFMRTETELILKSRRILHAFLVGRSRI